ncbi:MAG: BON domain-containing protein [Pseudomonadota bacterium]
MKPILISCIPLLALAAFQCSAAEQLLSTPTAPAQANAAADADPAAAVRAVEQALKNSRDPASDKVAVSSHASTIVLTGKADTQAEADRIQSIATTAAAGMRVSSEIEVDVDKDAALQQASSQLLKDVDNALRSDSTTASLRVLIALDDDQGIVLSGPVPSRQAQAAVERVAKRVPGVRHVDNRLTVPE